MPSGLSGSSDRRPQPPWFDANGAGLLSDAAPVNTDVPRLTPDLAPVIIRDQRRLLRPVWLGILGEGAPCD